MKKTKVTTGQEAVAGIGKKRLQREDGSSGKFAGDDCTIDGVSKKS